MAAARGYLPDVLPPEGCYERGFLHKVGVSKAQLRVPPRQILGQNARRQVTATSSLRDSAAHLPLTVAAPGIHVAGGGQCQHVFTAHGDVLDEQSLERRDHLGDGLVLQHGLWQADQAL